MAKKECYRYTEDGVLLVRKQEQGQAGALGLLPEYRELWFQCSEKNPDRHYLQMVLGGWFGLHKFMEGNWLQGIGYLLTCGCFGVFYLYDLFSMVCGNYCVKKVSYVDKNREVERRVQKIYYGPLQYRKRATLLIPVAVAKCVSEEEAQHYTQEAINILKACDEKFCNYDDDEDALVLMGTKRYPKNEAEWKGGHIPIIYGDFFFVEAMLKLKGNDFFIW